MSPRTSSSEPGFDAKLAVGPVRRVSPGRLVDLLGVPHDPATVRRYRERMEAGDRFPPIAVVRLGRGYLVADGHKRLSAWRQLGAPGDLPVEVWGVRRWLSDQRRQVEANLRKKRRILAAVRHDRAEARRLLWTTVEHWWRVARSLARLVGRRRRGW